MTVISRGYLTLPQSFVRLEPLSFEIDGAEADVAVLGRIEDWSYYQPIVVRTVIGLDVEEALEKLRLPQGASIDAQILWVSGGTSLRGASAPVAVDADTTLELTIAAGLVRQQLSVTVVLVLSGIPDVKSHPLAPHEVGAVLWEQTERIDLEGIAPRLPVLPLSFAQYHPDSAGAMWWLQISDEDASLELQADSVFWMWLNSDNPHINEILAAADSPAADRTRHHMRIDYLRQLVQFALRREDLDPQQVYPAGSLGERLAAVTSLVGEHIDVLRHSSKIDPGELDMRIQAAFGDEDIS